MRIRPRKLVVPAILLAVLGLVLWALTSGSVDVDTAVIGRGSVRSFVEEEARTRVVGRFVLSSPVAGRLLRVEAREDDPVEAGDVVARIDPLGLESQAAQAESQIAELRARIRGVDRRRPKEGELRRAALRVTIAEESCTVAREGRAEAEATLAKAERDAGRARDLREDGTISPDELEASVLAETRARASAEATRRQERMADLSLEVARIEAALLAESSEDLDWEQDAYRAQVASAEARLHVLRDDLERVEVRSPVTGVVLRRHEESETIVAAGTPILEVGDVTELEVEADMLSEDVTRMTVGQDVEVYGRALGGRTIRGKIARIHPGAFVKVSSLGVEQQRATVVAAFDPDGVPLGDAYRVQLRVIFGERTDVLLVPESALFRHGDGWAVFRVEDGRTAIVRVETGLADGRVREVLSGLGEGDVVVVHPDRDLEAGSVVR
jgi:HlyD family secretion protein